MTRQAHRARGALLRAGRKVFETKGYYGARVADVAAEAGMSVGSFYTYFDSKETLFRDVLIEVEDEVYGELSPAGPQSDDPRERIRQTNLLYFTSFRRNVDFWRAVEESALTNADARRVLAERRRYYRGRTRRALSRWQDRGLIGDALDPDFTAAALGAMTERCAYLWYIIGADPIDPETAATEVTALWLTTLGLPARPRPST